MIAETLAEKKLVEVDQWGKKTYAKMQPEGTECWVRTRPNGKINSAGLNKVIRAKCNQNRF